MKLSFSSVPYCSSPVWLPAYPIDYVIKNLSKIGYDGIELLFASPVAYPAYMSKQERERIVKLLKEYNIKISSFLPNPGGGCGNNVASPIEDERKLAIENFKESIDLGHDLGAKICLYVPGWVIWGVDQYQAWEWSKECLIEVAKYANTKDVMLAIEPTPVDSNLVDNADEALKMMREVNMDNVKVMFDTYHVFFRGDSLTDYVKKMGSDLVHIHISDVDRTAPGTYNDFRFMINELKSINYKGYLTIEIGFCSAGRRIDADSVAKKAYDYMKSIM